MEKSILRNKVTGNYFPSAYFKKPYCTNDTDDIYKSLSFVDLNVVFPYNFNISLIIDNYDIVSYDNELRKLKLKKLKK